MYEAVGRCFIPRIGQNRPPGRSTPDAGFDFLHYSRAEVIASLMLDSALRPGPRRGKEFRRDSLYTIAPTRSR